MVPKVAEVIINIPHGEVDRVFDYLIPPCLRKKIKPGCKVRIPFGHGFRQGFVWRLKEESAIEKIKPLKDVLGEPLLNSTQLKLVEWLVKNYFCFHITALEAVVPPEITREAAPKESRVYKLSIEQEIDWGKAVKQKAVWEYLNSIKYPPLKNEIEREVAASSSTIRTMEKKGLLEIKRVISGKDPLAPRPEKPEAFPEPGGQQKGLDLHSEKPVVLHYGPGETIWPLYFSLVDDKIKMGQSVILLVPEAQLADRVGEMLVKYFPAETVILHSDLAPRERYGQWWKCKKNSPSVLVGTRSAVFAPVANLGLLIIHNEEDEAYRQQENPRYITAEVARERVNFEGGGLLLSSASPSLKSFYGIYKKNLTYRESPALKMEEAGVELVDMREEFGKGNISIFSQKTQALLQELKESKKNKVFLYVNRRGYAPFILCRSCGFVARCESCKRAMTFHKEGNILYCHRCKRKQKSLQVCPECESKYIRSLGIGTEKVSEEINKLFPDLKQVMVDSDRVKNQIQLEKLSGEIEKGKWEIVIGTRLMLKEFFPLFDVGIMVMADTQLNLPFYDCQEDLFHLINANLRRVKGGKLFIQTYNPDHLTLRLAAKNDWKEFMSKELHFRQEFSYPPVTQFLVYILSGTSEQEVARGARKLAKEIAVFARRGDLEMIGPVPSYFSQERGKYRWQISCRSSNREVFREMVSKTSPATRELIRDGIGVNLELNPKGML